MVAQLSSPNTEAVTRRELHILLKRILDRVYVDGIDRIVNVTSDKDGNVSGYFVGDRSVFEFEIKNGKLEYNLAQRKDSWVEGFVATIHLDAPRRKKKKCTKGFPCGDACIARGLKCLNNLSRYASPNESSKIRQLAMRLSTPATKGAIASQPDNLDNLSIRELKKEASRWQVTGYSNMTSEQLRQSIRQAKSDPKAQERAEKALRGRRASREQVLSVLPKDLAKAWRRVTKIKKVFQANPEYSGLLAAALITTVSVGTMQKLKERYKDGLDDSAKMALDRSGSIPLENIQGKPGILFAVGGLNTGTPGGQKIKELLDTPRDATPAEKWFAQNNHTIAFDHPSDAISPPKFSAKNPDGSYNPAYLGFLAKAGFGKSIENWRQNGRNEAAVDLAAQIYAYGSQHKNADLNVIGHGAGGATVREAAEILSRMNPSQGGPRGADMVRRMNVVNMGSPYFGFTDDKFWKETKNRTLVSRQDPTSILPAKLPQFINSVKSHEIGDFLENNEVRERIRETFGYYTSSVEAKRKQEANKALFRSTFGEVLNDVSPAAGRLYKRINRISDMTQKNPQAASILAGVTLIGGSYGQYRFLRNRYNAGLDDSAKAATEIYTQQYGKGTPSVTSSNVMFTVGSSTSSSEDIARQIEENNITAAGGQRYQTVAYNPQMGADEYPHPPDNLKEGSVEYNAWIAQHEYSRTLGRSLKGVTNSVPIPGVSRPSAVRNPEALKLAAQVYAYGKATQNKGWGKKPIAMLAHGAGGMTAREAIQVLERMKPDGMAIAKRIKLATIATPSFGISDEVTETSLQSKKDFFSKLPHKGKGQTTVYESIEGRDTKHFLKNEQVRQQLKRTFTGEQESKERESERIRRNQREQEKAKAKTTTERSKQSVEREQQKKERLAQREKERKDLIQEAIANLNKRRPDAPVDAQNLSEQDALRVEREMLRIRSLRRTQNMAKTAVENPDEPQPTKTTRRKKAATPPNPDEPQPTKTTRRKKVTTPPNPDEPQPTKTTRSRATSGGNAPQTPPSKITPAMQSIIQQMNASRPPGERIDPNNLTPGQLSAIKRELNKKKKGKS